MEIVSTNSKPIWSTAQIYSIEPVDECNTLIVDVKDLYRLFKLKRTDQKKVRPVGLQDCKMCIEHGVTLTKDALDSLTEPLEDEDPDKADAECCVASHEYSNAFGVRVLGKCFIFPLPKMYSIKNFSFFRSIIELSFQMEHAYETDTPMPDKIKLVKPSEENEFSCDDVKTLIHKYIDRTLKKFLQNDFKCSNFSILQSGKRSYVRSYLLGHRHNGARMTMVVDNELGPNSISIPRDIYDNLDLATNLVIINRDPSINDTCIYVCEMFHHDTDPCIHLNPFVLDGLHADQDGDDISINYLKYENSMNRNLMKMAITEMRSMSWNYGYRHNLFYKPRYALGQQFRHLLYTHDKWFNQHSKFYRILTKVHRGNLLAKIDTLMHLGCSIMRNEVHDFIEMVLAFNCKNVDNCLRGSDYLKCDDEILEVVHSKSKGTARHIELYKYNLTRTSDEQALKSAFDDKIDSSKVLEREGQTQFSLLHALSPATLMMGDLYMGDKIAVKNFTETSLMDVYKYNPDSVRFILRLILINSEEFVSKWCNYDRSEYDFTFDGDDSSLFTKKRQMATFRRTLKCINSMGKSESTLVTDITGPPNRVDSEAGDNLNIARFVTVWKLITRKVCIEREANRLRLKRAAEYNIKKEAVKRKLDDEFAADSTTCSSSVHSSLYKKLDPVELEKEMIKAEIALYDQFYEDWINLKNLTKNQLYLLYTSKNPMMEGIDKTPIGLHYSIMIQSQKIQTALNVKRLKDVKESQMFNKGTMNPVTPSICIKWLYAPKTFNWYRVSLDSVANVDAVLAAVKDCVGYAILYKNIVEFYFKVGGPKIVLSQLEQLNGCPHVTRIVFVANCRVMLELYQKKQISAVEMTDNLTNFLYCYYTNSLCVDHSKPEYILMYNFVAVMFLLNRNLNNPTNSTIKLPLHAVSGEFPQRVLANMIKPKRAIPQRGSIPASNSNMGGKSSTSNIFPITTNRERRMFKELCDVFGGTSTEFVVDVYNAKCPMSNDFCHYTETKEFIGRCSGPLTKLNMDNEKAMKELMNNLMDEGEVFEDFKNAKVEANDSDVSFSDCNVKSIDEDEEVEGVEVKVNYEECVEAKVKDEVKEEVEYDVKEECMEEEDCNFVENQENPDIDENQENLENPDIDENQENPEPTEMDEVDETEEEGIEKDLCLDDGCLDEGGLDEGGLYEAMQLDVDATEDDEGSAAKRSRLE
ncbi:late expression factor 9 [Helicoverpa zea nudivirus 2]|uniref:Late expression factor 9 n=1 Tax=Helicoverpa zea nudivirus 2 TaxID=1128424 RepID=G9I089_HZNV2|nr:orf63 gene product [Helicoverpa zea nudivirus 2]AEW69612.1 late expression factor 9 [Helicoverpa zea nudivirus 2]